jgi:hypothetical protein
MDVKEFALNALNDAQAYLMQALDGLSDEDIIWQPGPGANHIAFILWHMFREEDRFFQFKLRGIPQVWEQGGWAERLDLPEDPQDVGFGWSAEQVAAFPRVRLTDLLAYGKAVRARTMDYLENAAPATMHDAVKSDVFGDTSAGNRIAHLIVELAEHIGQIDYIHGLRKGVRPMNRRE